MSEFDVDATTLICSGGPGAIQMYNTNGIYTPEENWLKMLYTVHCEKSYSQ